MDQKYPTNGFPKKSPSKHKPNYVSFNGESSAKVRKIQLSPRSNGNTSENGLRLEDRKKLPVYQARDKIMQHVRKHDTLILIGETGSGKTTQIPQFIHEERSEKEKRIGITQPRRVAATTIAHRVSQEMGCSLGTLVGYTIRFEDNTSAKTKLKYMTDGMLLREAIFDDNLMEYSVLILDEAHERTIHTDILFGIVKQAQKFRREKNKHPLKVVIMSATIDVDHFSSYFGNVPVLYLEGRQYQVQIYHSLQTQEDYVFSCLVTVFQIHKEAPANHDILVFLTGQEEIETMVKNIRMISKSMDKDALQLKVVPLYSSLPMSQQVESFRPTPPGMRKVIVSTNIAETSVTVSGIKYVVDSGMVKARTHNTSSHLDVLKVQRISQAQCWQRTGRAGRDSDGHCYRVFTKLEFDKMTKNTVPEIQRCNLASVCIQLLAIGVDVLNFDYMDKPPQEMIIGALSELQSLGAISSIENPKLTDLGYQMSKFPIHPRYSKILLSSRECGCVEEILSIIAILSGESILAFPSSKRDEAKEAHKKFVSSAGDHVTYLQILRQYKKVSHPKQWCHENFLSLRNLQYASSVRAQLSEICKKCDIPLTSCGQDFEKVRKCLLTGLFMNVAELQTDKQYVMVSTRQPVSIHPSSVLFGTLPYCVLFSEVIQTNKCYMRELSLLDPDWLLQTMPDYFKKYRLNNVQQER